MSKQIYFYPPTKGKKVDVVESFFESYPIEEAKGKLWELLKAAMENEQYVLEEKPSNTIYFYERLSDLLTFLQSK